MSELKDYSILDIEAIDDERLKKSESGKIQETRVYIKFDADKVIRHQKYKRCLAMARWCRTSARCDENLGAFKYRDWYWKWFKRWLELAEKFKPSNTTAQQGKGNTNEHTEQSQASLR